MKIIISNSAKEPIYEQIVKQIKSEILKGTLAPGDSLPSIRNLAKELCISVITTKRAYDELEHEGFIETVGGKGTFVSSQNKEFIREKRLKILEEKLCDVVTDSKMLNLSLSELEQMLKLIYEGCE